MSIKRYQIEKIESLEPKLAVATLDLILNFTRKNYIIVDDSTTNSIPFSAIIDLAKERLRGDT